MKRVYPAASPTKRTQLLDRVCRGPEGEDAVKLKERTRQHKVYVMLDWLRRAAPDCTLVANRLEQMNETHSGEFASAEHPDVLGRVFVELVEGARSPYTVDEMLSRDPSQMVDELLQYQGYDSFGDPDRSGLLNAVAEAAARDYSWGRILSLELASRHALDSDLWGPLLDGWQEGLADEQQWAETLDLLREHTELYVFADKVANLLTVGINKPRGAIPSDYLSSAATLAEAVWDACNDGTWGVEAPKDSWSGTPMDIAAMRIIKFWLYVLSRIRRKVGENWGGIPEEYRDRFKKVTNSASSAAQRSTSILAGSLHSLFAFDAQWTIYNVIPLLDWSRHPARAQHAWRGFLTWGTWSEDLLPYLLPLYVQAISYVPKELVALREREKFSQHVASIAVHSTSNPVEDGWLRRYLVAADPEDRRLWAKHVGLSLRRLKEDGMFNVWSD